MAGPNVNYDQISAITQKKFIPKVVDNIFDSNPKLQRAKKKYYTRVDGGTSIVQPLNYAQVTAAGSYSGAQTLDTTDNDVITAAEYAWKTYYANITIQGIDEIKNSGDAAIVKFVAQKTQIAEKTLADIMGTALYNSGTDATGIGGLRLWLSASNTVGGISQSSYSWWRPVLDSSSTSLGISVLQALHNSATIGNDGPTVAYTTRTLYNSLYGQFQPQQRFQDSETAKGGFSSLMFNGVPVIVDSHVPANYFIFENEDYEFLYYHPSRDFAFQPFLKPVNQDVRTAKIFWAGAFGSSNLRMFAAATALTS
jgi:hypothetical protein